MVGTSLNSKKSNREAGGEKPLLLSKIQAPIGRRAFQSRVNDHSPAKKFCIEMYKLSMRDFFVYEEIISIDKVFNLANCAKLDFAQ